MNWENIMNNPNMTSCLALHRAYAKLRSQLDDDLGTYHGIDFDDFALLHALTDAESSQMPLSLLAAELGASRSAMLRQLRPLEKIGLIAFEGSMTDRVIVLRPAGHGVVAIADDTVTRVCVRSAMPLSN